ncbi:MAG TPA: PepSY-associated TM helix domain-containing protein, partial [Salinimicrobium sp.]|nr:PepSY-associated TM helix domain-containing protein [Salinimicrobium sp.]
ERINFKNRRSLNSSLHRVIGVWSLLLNLLLAVTGLFLSYEVVMASLAEPRMPNSPFVSTPIKHVLEEIAEKKPDFTPTYISLPASEEGAISIFGLYKDDPFYFSEFYNSFTADYRTGKITASSRIQEADLGTKLKSTLIPLHFGNFGGIWTKLLYCFAGLSGPLLSITGFIIWQKGKKTKRRKNRLKK